MLSLCIVYVEKTTCIIAWTSTIWVSTPWIVCLVSRPWTQTSTATRAWIKLRISLPNRLLRGSSAYLLPFLRIHACESKFCDGCCRYVCSCLAGLFQRSVSRTATWGRTAMSVAFALLYSHRYKRVDYNPIFKSYFLHTGNLRKRMASTRVLEFKVSRSYEVEYLSQHSQTTTSVTNPIGWYSRNQPGPTMVEGHIKTQKQMKETSRWLKVTTNCGITGSRTVFQLWMRAVAINGLRRKDAILSPS